MAVKPGSVVRAMLGLASLLGREVETLLANGSETADGTNGSGSDPHDVGTDWVHLGWGALAAGGERAARTVALARLPIGAAADFGSWVLEAPAMAPAARRMRATVTELVERGKSEDLASRDAASALADRVLWRVVNSEIIDLVVVDVLHRAIGPALEDLSHRSDDLVALVRMIVGEVIGPVLDQALPVAFEKIQGEPELLVPVLEAVVNDALEPLLREVLPRCSPCWATTPRRCGPSCATSRRAWRPRWPGASASRRPVLTTTSIEWCRRVLRRKRVPDDGTPRALPPGAS